MKIKSLSLAIFLTLSLFIFSVKSSHAAAEQFNQAKATWNLVNGAKCYNLYYKRVENPNWNHSVRCIPNNMWTYTIKNLKLGQKYVYSVAALGYNGKEYSWSPITALVTSPMIGQ